MKALKDDYPIVIRSAGSHSPIDIIAIDPKGRKILLIQSKGGKTRKRAIHQVVESGILALQGDYAVSVEVK